jgi:uncharacterized protein (TIGR02284 family)
MDTMRASDSDVMHMLRNMIELEYDMVGAYATIVERLEDPKARQQLCDFKDDHERHITDLTVELAELGGKAPFKGDLDAVLEEGEMVIANLIADRALLQTMPSNEQDTNKAYEQATARTDTSPELASLLERNLADEIGRRSWLEQRIRQLSV